MHFFILITLIIVFGVAYKKHLNLGIFEPWPQTKYYPLHAIAPVIAATVVTFIVMEIWKFVAFLWNG